MCGETCPPEIIHTVPVGARLDYFFMFKADGFKIKESDTFKRDLSDGSPTSLSLQVAKKKQTN